MQTQAQLLLIKTNSLTADTADAHLGAAGIFRRGDCDHALDFSPELRHLGVLVGGVGVPVPAASWDALVQALSIRLAAIFGLAVLERALLADGAWLVLFGLWRSDLWELREGIKQK